MNILIVIDMQNDFVTGLLGTPEAVAIIDKIKNKIEIGKYDSLYFTRDTHLYNYLESQEGKKLPIKHCIQNTPGWCIVEDLNEYSQKAKVINKLTFGYADWYSEFFGIDMFKRSSNNLTENDKIEIVGVCTDICVISNALILKAIAPETPIIVDASCCAGTTPEMHQKALDVMKSCQIEVINENI